MVTGNTKAELDAENKAWKERWKKEMAETEASTEVAGVELEKSPAPSYGRSPGHVNAYNKALDDLVMQAHNNGFKHIVIDVEKAWPGAKQRYAERMEPVWAAERERVKECERKAQMRAAERTSPPFMAKKK